MCQLCLTIVVIIAVLHCNKGYGSRDLAFLVIESIGQQIFRVSTVSKIY